MFDLNQWGKIFFYERNVKIFFHLQRDLITRTAYIITFQIFNIYLSIFSSYLFPSEYPQNTDTVAPSGTTVTTLNASKTHALYLYAVCRQIM